jgi:hypothetical protein
VITFAARGDQPDARCRRRIAVAAGVMLGGLLAISPASAAPAETGADLEVAVAGGASHPLPEGATASASVLIGNLGPGPVSSPPTLSVSLGGGLEFIAASGDGWTCTSGQDFQCTMINTTAPFADPDRVFGIVLVDVRRTAPGTITATLTSGEDDPQLFNNTSVYDVLDDQPPPRCDGCPAPPIGVPLDVPLPDTGAPTGPISIAALTVALFGVGLATISRRRPAA